MDKILKQIELFVGAVCAIANEFKRHNDLLTEKTDGQAAAAGLPVRRFTAPNPEDVNRAAIIAELTKLGVKAHGKTSTENLKKLLDETLAGMKKQTAEAAPVVKVDPFEEGAATPAVTKEQVKQALIAAGASKGPIETPEGEARAKAAVELLESVAGVKKFSEVPVDKYPALLIAANKLAAS